jgi:single-strand DNA-binding protein
VLSHICLSQQKEVNTLNQVGLVGRLTKDPNYRVISDTKRSASFVLAVNRNFKNQQGRIEADFVLCVAWGRLAERIEKHCGKGSLIGVTGRLQSRSYVNKENVRVYTTEVVVEDVRFYQLKEKQFNLAALKQGEAEQPLDNFETPTEQITAT